VGPDVTDWNAILPPVLADPAPARRAPEAAVVAPLRRVRLDVAVHRTAGPLVWFVHRRPPRCAGGRDASL